jgi:DNA polymerase I-like protein with 3'-5' exonuclease and polymerase domains
MNVLQRTDGKIVLTKEEAEKFIGLYHSLFPEIREWHAEIDAIVFATRTLYNLQGFPLYFGGNINNAKAKKESYARIPQSTVGTITNIAYADIQDFIEENSLADEWDVLVNKHDSILMQVPIEHETHAAAILSAAMQPKLVGRDGVEFNMKTEAASGYNWGKHSDSNPRGMKDIT